MDTLEGFLESNDASLVVPLLSRLKIVSDDQVYLPDDVAILFLANHLHIPVETVLESGKFIQMLRYGINAQGFPRAHDEQGRETIDGLAVLATMRIGNITYNIIDGILGKGNDVQEIAIVQTWLDLPNDLFRNLVRTNRIKGKELLSLCSSNRTLSTKCDSSNGALFRQLLATEFGVQLPADINARARYAQIYRDYDVLKNILDKIKSWSYIGDNILYIPSDIYDLLYSENLNRLQIDFREIQHEDRLHGTPEVALIGLEGVNEVDDRTMDFYRKAMLGVDLIENIRRRLGAPPSRRKIIRVFADSERTSELNLIIRVGVDHPEVALEAARHWVKNLTSYMQIAFLNISDGEIKARIKHNLRAIRNRFIRARERVLNHGLNQKNINTIDLTNAEIDLIVKIHRAVLKGTIDVSFSVGNHPIYIAKIVSRLE